MKRVKSRYQTLKICSQNFKKSSPSASKTRPDTGYRKPRWLNKRSMRALNSRIASSSYSSKMRKKLQLPKSRTLQASRRSLNLPNQSLYIAAKALPRFRSKHRRSRTSTLTLSSPGYAIITMKSTKIVDFPLDSHLPLSRSTRPILNNSCPSRARTS